MCWLCATVLRDWWKTAHWRSEKIFPIYLLCSVALFSVLYKISQSIYSHGYLSIHTRTNSKMTRNNHLICFCSDKILTVVNKYVRFPCAMELRMYVNNDQKKALQFLVSYLRKRGPIMHWQIRPGTDEVMGRYVTFWVLVTVGKLLFSFPNLLCFYKDQIHTTLSHLQFER